MNESDQSTSSADGPKINELLLANGLHVMWMNGIAAGKVAGVELDPENKVYGLIYSAGVDMTEAKLSEYEGRTVSAGSSVAVSARQTFYNKDLRKKKFPVEIALETFVADNNRDVPEEVMEKLRAMDKKAQKVRDFDAEEERAREQRSPGKPPSRT